MHFIKRLGVVWIAVAAVACSKQTGLAKEEQDAGSRITGAWQWVRTDGGIGYNIHDTPLSAAKEIELKINSNSTYAVFTNDAVTSQGTYTLEKRTCIHDQAEKWYIRFSADQHMMIEKTESGTLYLSDELYDGVETEYARPFIR